MQPAVLIPPSPHEIRALEKHPSRELFQVLEVGVQRADKGVGCVFEGAVELRANDRVGFARPRVHDVLFDQVNEVANDVRVRNVWRPSKDCYYFSMIEEFRS